MSDIQANGAKLFYKEVGNGPETLFFSHGYLMNHTMFDRQVAAFKDHFRCIVYDQRGHGQSEITPDGYGIYNLMEDALSLIERLGKRPVHFVGMSTGGFIGLRLALKRPDLIKSMILMDTSAETEPRLAMIKYNFLMWVVKNFGTRPVMGQVMPILFHKTFLNDPARKDEKAYWYQAIRQQDPKGIVPFGRGIFSRDNLLDQVGKITLPLGLIVGEEDVALPLIRTQNIHHRVPHSHLFSIADAGHTAAVEKSEEVIQAMHKFFTTYGII